MSLLGEFVSTTLNQSNINVHSPEGGFYVFPDFNQFKEKLASRSVFTSNDLCEFIFDKTSVALLPGTAFGIEPENLVARLAYVDFNGDSILTLTDDQVLSGAPKVEKGISKLAELFNNL